MVARIKVAIEFHHAGILFIKGVLRFIWCFVLVGAMRTPFVVELHIFGNPFLEFVFRPVGAPVQFFLLQRGEEGLHYTVIVGRAPFGEGLRHMAIAQKSSEGLGGILASPVGVEDQILAGIPFLKCLLESGGELCHTGMYELYQSELWCA